MPRAAESRMELLAESERPVCRKRIKLWFRMNIQTEEMPIMLQWDTDCHTIPGHMTGPRTPGQQFVGFVGAGLSSS